MPTVLSGKFEDPTGAAVANGTLFLTLSQASVVISTAQVAPSVVAILLDSTGSISASAPTIFGNDVLSPAGTVYFAKVVNANGQTVWQPNQGISIGGSSFNFNTALPTSQGVVLANAVLQNPTGPQTITGFGLTLTSSAPLTIGGLANLNGGGSLTGTFSGNAVFSGSFTVSGTATLGNGNSFSAVTFSNHNNQYWAGPGPLPTVDQAVTACGSLPGCIVHISPGYTGPESVNLVVNSMGYLVYVGPNNITILDYRSCPGTPGNGFTCPIYGQIFGGRLAGQRNRIGISYTAHNETDSAFGGNSFVWIDGNIPTNGGGLGGQLNAAELVGTVTVGASTTEIAASANEVDANATSADNPLFSVYGVVSGINFTRVAAAQNIITAKAFGAKTCSNAVSAPAKMFYCYGFHAEPQTGGTYRNFGFHSAGDLLFENGVRIFASSADTTVGVTATSSGQTGTFTMASNCAANPTFVAGALVAVTGMSVAGYNNAWVISAAGCSGSSWSAFMPGTSNLASGSGGTAQTTTPTVVASYGFGGTNQITHQPLADNPGIVWKNKAGSTTLAQLTASFFNVNVNLNAGVLGTALGTTGGPWGSLGIGTTGSNFFVFSPAATAGLRAVNINDTNGVATVSLPLLNSAGTAGIQTKRVASCTTAATAGSTCTTTVTWTTAFADTSYTATCSIGGVTNVPYVLNFSQLAASITVTIANLTAAAASGTLHCTAQHD